MAKALTEASFERDTAKIELAKKEAELDHTQVVLKETQEAFTECLAEVQNPGTVNRSLEQIAGPSSSTGMVLPLQHFELLRHNRAFDSTLIQEEDLEEITLDELKAKHLQLVRCAWWWYGKGDECVWVLG